MSIRSRSLIIGLLCSCPLCVDSAVVSRAAFFFLDDPRLSASWKRLGAL